MIVPWPKTWPLYKQACFAGWDKACDIVVGPCSCGATHVKGEFTYREGILRRYGVKVDTGRGQISAPQS